MFYHEICPILDKIIQRYDTVDIMQYSDFDEIKKIGSGGYGAVYTAKYKGTAKYRRSKYSVEEDTCIPQTVVLKRFKSFDETLELFISEVSNC